MTPTSLFQQRRQEFNLEIDATQESILRHMDLLHAALLSASTAFIGNSFLNWFFKRKQNPIHGIYLWGGVGRGKTLLMDIFYESLSAAIPKQRVHFHRFMQQIHQQLNTLKHIPNPLSRVADRLSSEAKVLCLDEFHVNDIADAMLLAGLFKALFDQGICLLTTSNRPPDDLYKGGLQRARFLPAIALLKAHTSVLQLDSPIDYRLLTLQREHTYFYPLDKRAEDHLHSIFQRFTINMNDHSNAIEINGRQLKTKGAAEGAIWFDFSELCDSPRSNEDYLELAHEHHSVFISGVPLLNELSNNAARRFLNLLDILYDHRVKLILSAAGPIKQLYTGTKLAFEFDRGISRLIEMQSKQYLAQSHLP